MSKPRLYLGIVLVCIAAILPFISVPLISMSPLSVTAKATAITIAVAGLPEVLLLLAGFAMGKQNLSALMKRLMMPFRQFASRVKRKLSQSNYQEKQ